MPNERNVAALVEVIASTGLTPQHDSWIRAMAKALADRSVLVPSSLTREDAERVLALNAAVIATAFALGPGPLREVLEEIAKGEG